MNGPRRAPAGRALAALALILALAALAVWLAVRVFSGTAALVRTDGGAPEPDPQFAEPAAAVTRPPELSAEEGPAPAADDPSAHWDPGAQTPVDKTADELSAEAAAQARSSPDD